MHYSGLKRAIMMAAAFVSPLPAQRPVAAEHRIDSDMRAVKALLARPVTVHLTNVSLKQAVDAVAMSAKVLVQYRTQVIEAYRIPVTLQATNLPLELVFDRILKGTALHVVADGTSQLAIVEGILGNTEGSSEGTLTGTVRDAQTRQPVAGVTIILDGTNRGVMTDDAGAFRIAGVSAGAHSLFARRVGYLKVTKSIQVTDGTNTAMEIILTPSANTLDQIVVTGTIIPTELKAVPNAITVITAKDIEQRGITKIDQLFRGDVPGLFAQNRGSGETPLDEVVMFSRGATALSSYSAGVTAIGSSNITNPIKTYVDGIELADPKYLSQIDPKSIERIEILTGPQASTIYGSNAINGVMQIFTKRGSSATPQLTLNLLNGWIENNFRPTYTPEHDYSAQMNGLEGHLSYNVGGSWNYIGQWTPAKQTTRLDGFDGLRFEFPTVVGRVTADATLRRGSTRNVQRGGFGQALTTYQETGWAPSTSGNGLARPTTTTLAGQTLGLTLNYTPISSWSHEFGIGQDVSDTEQRIIARGYTSLFDTTLSLQQNHADRRSLHYTTTAQIPITSWVQATLISGADAWQNLTSAWSVAPQTLTGTLTGTTSVSRQPGHNTGGFLQAQLGVREQLFLTYGLRAEWNPGYGADAQPNYAPRYGIAYTKTLGTITAKLRGSYGRSTRPPQPNLKSGVTAVDFYGAGSSTLQLWAFDYRYLPNVNLAPENQQGGEGGAELYFGEQGSLIVTRYNQKVYNLLESVVVDSVDLRPEWQAVYGSGKYYQRINQYLNLGSIRNQGWELQGSVNAGPFTTHGTYSWTKSRTIGINPKYRAQFPASSYPQYQPGAMFRYLPEHTWALAMMYGRAASSVEVNVTGTGQLINFQNDWSLRNFGARLVQNQLNISTSNRYVNFNKSYALVDVTAAHRFFARTEGLLQIQNLADHYTNDYWGADAVMGRQTKAGLRVKW